MHPNYSDLSRILLVGALCALGAACAPERDAPKPSETGADIFDENCSACHGEGGGGPSLDQIRALSSQELRARIRNHPTAGQIPQRLPAAQIGDLIVFLEGDKPEAAD